ncbi:hypothetical protein [Embleya sp. NPDC005575]|uniref:hypothetical protein n=1 Tax=Embleya sp. NPDC005575 TaxID=3156892 RepID=UPI0033A36B03
MAIPMPDEHALRASPRRDLVEAFHRLYQGAGRPGTRAIATAISRDTRLPSTVSHETLSALLHGRAVPDWSRLESAVRHLASVSIHRPEPEPLVLEFHVLWNAERDAAPAPASEAKAITAEEWFAVMKTDDQIRDWDLVDAVEAVGVRPDEPLTLRTAMLLLAWVERARNTRHSPMETARRVSAFPQIRTRRLSPPPDLLRRLDETDQ